MASQEVGSFVCAIILDRNGLWKLETTFFCMMKCVIGLPPSSVGLFHRSVTLLLSKSTIPGSRGSLGGSAEESIEFWTCHDKE